MPYKLDFKKLAEEIDIFAVAKSLDLTITKDRATCPVCDSERSLQFFADSNSFRCHSAELSGDCISLYAHINGVGMYQAAKVLSEQFQTAEAAGRSTSPQKPGGVPPPSASTAAAREAPKKGQPAPFDPAKFASRLEYTDEVKALGLTEEQAQRFGIGYCATGSLRGFVCFPITDGTETHYLGWNGEEFKLPKWQSNVVPLKRRA